MKGNKAQAAKQTKVAKTHTPTGMHLHQIETLYGYLFERLNSAITGISLKQNNK